MLETADTSPILKGDGELVYEWVGLNCNSQNKESYLNLLVLRHQKNWFSNLFFKNIFPNRDCMND